MDDTILLITSDFLPSPSANGVCAYNLAKVLEERGHNVHVLSPRKLHEPKEEVIEGIPVRRILIHPITESIRNVKVRNFIHRVNIAIHFFMYPLTSVIAIVNYAINIKKLISKCGVNRLITLNNPLLGCLSTALVKRFLRNGIRFVVFDLDSFSNTIEGQYISHDLRDKLLWRWERIILNSADLVVVMDNHMEHYSKQRYYIYREKIRTAGFPVLRIRSTNLKATMPKSQENINCLFFGSLSLSYRNPDVACHVFEGIPSISFSLYGNAADTVKMLNSISSITNGRVTHKGFVPYIRGQELLENADFLVSIGNRESDMVPSKVFEYASFCKPIIHFFFFPEDPVIVAFANYPLLLLLDSTLPINKLIEKVQQFIKETYGCRADAAVIQKLFIKNTPEYSINLIEEFLTQIPSTFITRSPHPH